LPCPNGTFGFTILKDEVFTMQMNIATWDRIIRLIIGVIFLAWAIAGGPVWAYLGLALIATGSWRFDPFYAIFRTGTIKS
jgi:hypothetical protein